jgi:hypothetical protein
MSVVASTAAPILGATAGGNGMTVFNLDGAVLFGPGSEWLWIFAQFIALAVTGLAIYRQLRAQAWANQLAIFSRFGDDFDSERMTRTKLSALIEVAGGTRRMTPSIERVGNFFENVAQGRFNGHMRPQFAWQEYRVAAQRYWAMFAPILGDLRQVDPTLWQDWERWLIEVRERDRRAGKAEDVCADRVAAMIPATIAYFIDRLRIEDEMRKSVIPTWPIPPGPGSAEPAVDSQPPPG